MEFVGMHRRQHQTRDRRVYIAESIAAIVVWSAAVLVFTFFGWVMWDLMRFGLANLSFEFLWRGPLDAGRAGGIGPMILSTLLILSVCMIVACPLGIGTALFLAEVNRNNYRFGRLVRRSLDALAAVPSIVFGLFGSALFCEYLSMGSSILAGGLTLGCMVLPLLVRTAEEAFRSVPDRYRQASVALGLSQTTMMWRVLLPVAAPGLVVAVVLSVGRAMAETAALIFTSGSVDRTPESLFDSGRALSVHIYELAMNVPGGNPNAYATACVLVMMLVAINGMTELIGHRFSPRQQR